MLTIFQSIWGIKQIASDQNFSKNSLRCAFFSSSSLFLVVETSYLLIKQLEAAEVREVRSLLSELLNEGLFHYLCHLHNLSQ